MLGNQKSFSTLVILLWSASTIIFGDEITLYVGAGSKECLFYEVESGSSFEVQFHVLRGGNFDISFTVLDPSGKLLVADMRRSVRLHKVTATSTGPYQFCLDNSFSSSSHKIVYFDIFMDTPPRGSSSERFEVSSKIPETEDAKIIKPILDKINANLDKSIHYQGSFAALEARDRSVIESNFESVNFWSAVHLCVMISAALVNLIVIRKLFNDNARNAGLTSRVADFPSVSTKVQNCWVKGDAEFFRIDLGGNWNIARCASLPVNIFQTLEVSSNDTKLD